MTEKIKSEEFIKAFGSGVKETEHHLITENKGDLISREVLKAEITKCQIADFIAVQSVQEIIDNAPTVEVPENAVNCVLTMFGKCSYNKTGCSDCEIKDKIRKALSERPQGEWLNTSPYDDKGECSLCCYLSKKYYKFCPNCGAEMKGGAE